MLVVTIATLDQALIHTMAKWHIELRLLLQVAGIAKFRLRLDQQILFRCRVVRRVTADAAYIPHPVDRIRAIELTWPGRMTGHATVIDFFCGMVLKNENLCNVAAPSDMVRPGTMTAFASLVGGPALGIQRGLPVRRLFPTVVDILVAGLAGVRSHIPGSIRRAAGRLVLARSKVRVDRVVRLGARVWLWSGQRHDEENEPRHATNRNRPVPTFHISLHEVAFDQRTQPKKIQSVILGGSLA